MLPEGCATLPLTQGRFAIVSAQDLDWICAWKYSWFYQSLANGPDGKSLRGYAASHCYENGARRVLALHRFITGAKKGELVDHINLNTLDNRRENLRIVDAHQNSVNRRKTPRRGCTSQYKGVSNTGRDFHPWRSLIYCRGIKVSLGAYATEMDAAIAYDIASRYLHGECGYRNFLAPDGVQHVHEKVMRAIQKSLCKQVC
jgi:hypothetical protein